MSLVVDINNLSEEKRNKIDTQLEIKIENKFCPGNYRYIYPYTINTDKEGNDYGVIPFAFSVDKLGIPRPPRNSFPPVKVKFEGQLRPEQEIVRKEAINHLNKKGSVIISCYPGFGKCLGYNTPVLMYDGNIKNVQDITMGEEIMGDDSKPRRILSVCTGVEKMYRITIDGIPESFECNRSHILSLKNMYIPKLEEKDFGEYYIKYLDPDKYIIVKKKFTNKLTAESVFNKLKNNDIIDITVRDYLKLPEDIQRRLKLYKTSVNFNRGYSESIYVPNNIGFLILNMHKKISNVYKLNSKKIRETVFDSIITYYFRHILDTKDKFRKLIIYEEQLRKDIIFLSKSLGYIAYMYNNEVFISKEKRDINLFNFKVTALDENRYYGFTIDGNRRFVLGDFTVTHNTIGSINLSTRIGFKTLVIVNKIILMKQWEDSILRFCPSARVQKITPKSKVNPDKDFYIINATNVEKFGKDTFKDIGTLIIDESHLILAEVLSKSLQYLSPRYLIGLSATPYRTDGLNILFDLYFGKQKIIRKLYREHIVYKVDTGFKPKIEKAKNGRLNWGVVLDSQANNIDRNELILKIIRKYENNTFLVLVKRVTQAEYLIKRLEEENEDVTSLLGDNQEFNINSRILIGTCQKCGTGFDHPKLNTLLLAADIEDYFIQYLGRVFRTKEGTPIIFDLVDNHGILKKHFTTRRLIYKEHGGIVKNINFD